MPTCVVPRCTSGYRSNPGKFHFFTIPKDPIAFELWKRALKREDVKPGRAVCENHFAKNEFVWQRELRGADGSVLGVSHYKIPRLIEGTVPSIFHWTIKATDAISLPQIRTDTVLQPRLECPQKDSLVTETDVLPQPPKRQKLLDESKENESPMLESLIRLQHQELPDRREGDTNEVHPAMGGENISNPSLTFDQLSARKIYLPPGWLIQRTVCEGTSLIILFINKCIIIDGVYKTFILKTVTVKDDLSVQVTVLGKHVDIEKFNLPCSITDSTQLQELVRLIHWMKVCKGCTGSLVETQMQNVNCSTVSKDITGLWRHHECSLLLSNVTACKFCRKTQKTLATKLRRWTMGKVKKPHSSALSPTLKKKMVRLQGHLRAANISKARALGKCKGLKAELKVSEARTAYCTNLNLEEQLKSGRISQNQVHVLQQIIDAAKHKNSKWRNYSEKWMLLCMLMYMRSSSGYEFLRSNEILPLPCVRTIRRYLSKINSTCGFDPRFFEAFKAALAKKEESQRHGILLLDETSTREGVSVETKNLTYKGLIDFGNDEQRCEDLFEKANHELVLKFHPLNDTYSQPVAVFALREPAKGDVLAKLTIKAIILLEGIGAKVHAVISDGANSSRKFWTEVGVSGVRGKVRNYFDHPLFEDRKVFVFSDTQRLIKAIRNRLHSNKDIGLQMSPTDPLIKWQYIKTLQEKDRELAGPGQLLICPKLTSDHVNLNKALKMQVRLAVQVFSNSVAAGLQFYENYVPELKGCEETASFCAWMNEMFDSLNRRYPIDGVQVGNLDFKTIEESLQKLDAWEEQVEKKKLSRDLFLTKETAEGLRVTLHSNLDLIRYLTENCGFEYVLTGRINQDPVEVWSNLDVKLELT